MPSYALKNSLTRRLNLWDLLVLLVVGGAIFMLARGAQVMLGPYQIGEILPISLSPSSLPFYAFLTVLRMFIALIVSMIFTLCVGTWAAKSKRAERWMIPAIDILQSVPVLSFLSVTVVGFIRLFPGSLLGPECACIFAIFTAQVWNMVFGFYQSLTMVPRSLDDVACVFHLSAWQKFWRIEVPFSLSGLLWNSMMSVSASWFFVVLSEAISVSHQSILLPGVGSYIAVAIEQSNKWAILYAVLTMLLVIFLYDQLLFRPLMKWSERFQVDESPQEVFYSSWVFNILKKTRLLKWIGRSIESFASFFINFGSLKKILPQTEEALKKRRRILEILASLCNSLLTVSLIVMVFVAGYFFVQVMSLSEIAHVFYLGTMTSLRVFILIFLCSILWIPVGVWIGMKPQLTGLAQPIIQFCAAFPANLFYPIFVISILTFHLNVNIWVSPLMILGTQWYILFNVIAGASRIPNELQLVTENFGVRGWQWWRTVGIPGVFPYYVTGAITAAGGAWNASIVAEWVSWGDTTLKAVGLGTYIHQYTLVGDFSRVALGTIVMCLFVVLFNCILWRPLYRLAQYRFKIQ